MATVGQPLTAPEAGWKRYDDTNPYMSYNGDWDALAGSSYYNNGIHNTNASGAQVSFNFIGTKLRIIGTRQPKHSTTITVSIDGIEVGNFNEYGSLIYQLLDFEITGLDNKEHYVQIANKATGGYGGYYDFDAIDIDDDGELKPPNPTPEEPEDPEQALLRVTVIDSSDHDYQLSSTEIDGFINWFMNHTNTDTAGYLLTKKTGTQNSKEYLAFDKIISFEVIPVA